MNAPVEVLLIEDSPGDADLVRERLDEEPAVPVRLTHAEVLGEGLRLVAERAFDVALLDLSLPDAHGLDAVRRMRRACPSLPLVVLTGVADEDVALQALREGAQDYLVKNQLSYPLLVRALRHAIERKQAEENLRESERRFRDMLEGAHLIALLLDGEGRVTFCNGYFLRLTGHCLEDVLGKDWFDSFLPPDVRERSRSQFRECAAWGTVGPHQETPILTRAGEARLVAWSSSALRGRRGKVIGTSHLGQDVTERRRLEEQFRQAQKMEAVGRLAGGVAHDFNNLLTVINGYSDLVLGELPGDSRCRGPIVEVRKAGERAAALTQQLLAFSRKQIVAPQVLSLNVFVTEMEKMLRRLIGEDVELATALDPAMGRVEADPGQVQQVIMNLVVNARDAMPQGGRLTIETRNAELDAASVEPLGDVAPGPYALLAVSDTGCGMTPEVRSRIFEPFFTTKGEGQGTGLGLATVYGIVKQSGGHVEVHSEVGHGTTFKVYLPRVREARPAAESPRDAFPIPGGAETVLLVEDEEGVRRLACLVLRSSGYTVLEAGDADQALRLHDAHREPIHLLVTDVVMPRTSGRVLADRLAGRNPGLRVLFMSGYTDDAVVRHGVQEEGIRFLQKPFTPATLARRVREVLDGEYSGGGHGHGRGGV